MERYRKQRDADTRRRGDRVKAVGVTGRRVTLSPARTFKLMATSGQSGFTLIELVMTITIMTILTLGVMPLVKVSVKRQKEQQLRDALRQMRIAIDEFHRDTGGMICTGSVAPPRTGQPPPPPDPRSRVAISDCTIFGVDNPDRYPPDLDTLVNGVNVTPRGGTGMGGQGLQSTGTQPGDSTSVLDSQLSTKKKVYLRAIPIDPMTGRAEWDLRSNYDASDAGSWGGENVFDVRSKSKETALNGEKYSDW
ncbi:MAG: type II secretion system GspH family protein [Acidobacteriota bacterium]|nr:type II secretion system GspH family protein [Acidobacteriota bacterium]